MAQRARYMGKAGEFVHGVPARHLSDEEYDALSTEQRAAVRSSGLYDVKTEAEAAPRATADDKPARADAQKGGDR